ncbi:hypothetical protein ACVW0I_006492 [Bradyrhizobium sp. LM6.11]
MRDVAIERGEIGMSVHHTEQIGAHVDEIAGAAGRAVEAADQLLPARLGGEVKGAGILVGRLGTPCLDRLGQAFPIRAEITHQCFEEGAASRLIQLLVGVEHLTRHGSARSFAPARQQRTAELDQPVGILRGVSRIPATKQRAATLGDGGEQVGEEGVCHLSFRVRFVRCGKLTRDLGGSRSQSSAGMRHACHAFPANSVGVRPVTWRNAAENAGTLA